MESPKGLKEFIRNPLGIIALFITMIYGVANLLLGKSVDSLTSAERWPLILFVVIFPIVVLVAFYWLVKNHHKKLYAPADFRSDESFLSAMTTPEVIDRLRAEVAESGQSTESSNSTERQGETRDSGPASTQLEGHNEAPTQQVHPAGIQALEFGISEVKKSFSERVVELARITEYFKLKYPEFSSHNAVSNVRLGKSKIAFDAANVDGTRLRALEVKYVSENGSAIAVIDGVLRMAKIAKDEVVDFSLLLVVVYETYSQKVARAQDRAAEMLKDYPYVEVVFVSRKHVPV